MCILKANILSGPLASVPSRAVSSTVVREERVNFYMREPIFVLLGNQSLQPHVFSMAGPCRALTSLCRVFAPVLPSVWCFI